VAFSPRRIGEATTALIIIVRSGAAAPELDGARPARRFRAAVPVGSLDGGGVAVGSGARGEAARASWLPRTYPRMTPRRPDVAASANAGMPDEADAFGARRGGRVRDARR
jgi:hypothetical protein